MCFYGAFPIRSQVNPCSKCFKINSEDQWQCFLSKRKDHYVEIILVFFDSLGLVFVHRISFLPEANFMFIPFYWGLMISVPQLSLLCFKMQLAPHHTGYGIQMYVLDLVFNLFLNSVPLVTNVNSVCEEMFLMSLRWFQQYWQNEMTLFRQNS